MLDDLLDKPNVSHNDVNFVVDKLNDVFKNSSLAVFGSKCNNKTYIKRADNKPWYNKKCDTKRKIFHRARKNYKQLKNAVNRVAMKEASKSYKNVLNKSFQDYQQKVADNLRKKSRSDPKGLWKILNNIDKSKTQVGENIDLNAFYDYFKNLNELDANDFDDLPEIDFDSIPPENISNILNSPILEEEILTVVKNLKNSKASGYDGIVNEHIKNTVGHFMSLYCKMFNLVLNTGIIPNSWSEGIMLPIFKNKGNVNDPSSYRPITLVSC